MKFAAAVFFFALIHFTAFAKEPPAIPDFTAGDTLRELSKFWG